MWPKTENSGWPTWRLERVPDLCESAGNQAGISTVLVAKFDTAFPSHGMKRVEELHRYSGNLSSIPWSPEFKQILVQTFLLGPGNPIELVVLKLFSRYLGSARALQQLDETEQCLSKCPVGATHASVTMHFVPPPELAHPPVAQDYVEKHRHRKGRKGIGKRL